MVFTVCIGAPVFFFKQKTAYEMRISDWSSDVCSSDLALRGEAAVVVGPPLIAIAAARHFDPRLLRRCRREPAVGQHLLTACDPVVQNELAEKIGRESVRERVCQYV